MLDYYDWSHYCPGTQLRDAVNRELTRQGLSRYALAQKVAGRVPASTLYGFLRGEHPLNSDALDHILKAVGLTIRSATTKGGK